MTGSRRAYPFLKRCDTIRRRLWPGLLPPPATPELIVFGGTEWPRLIQCVDCPAIIEPSQRRRCVRCAQRRRREGQATYARWRAAA